MNTSSALLAELHHADHIIKVMLNAMTLAQKSKCATQLEADGVSPDGMTRAHERAAVIQAANAAPYIASGEAHIKGTESAHVIAPSIASGAGAAEQVHEIEGHAVDVITQADYADILLRELFAKLDQMSSASPTVATINCFATCAARAVALMREAADNIVALVTKGDAA